MENQDQIWLPRNPISNQLFYDDRFIISDLIPEPIVWKISKVENIHPFGINKLTLAQEKFNYDTDYVNFDTGEMYASYYNQPLAPDKNDLSLEFVGENSIKVRGLKRTIKIHNYDSDIHEIEWTMTIDDAPADNLVDLDYVDDETVSIYFNGNESYIGSILTIKAKSGQAESQIDVKITAL